MTIQPPLPSRLGKPKRRWTIDGDPMVYMVEDEIVFETPSTLIKLFMR
jgi:hypothetical protein